MPTAIRPQSSAQIAKSTLDRVAAGGSFGKPVTMTGAQFEAFGKKLSTLAKSNPERAATLLQRTLDLYGQGKVKVEVPGAPISYAGRNVVASVANSVSAAIRKADPNVQTPAPMMLAR